MHTMTAAELHEAHENHEAALIISDEIDAIRARIKELKAQAITLASDLPDHADEIMTELRSDVEFWEGTEAALLDDLEDLGYYHDFPGH